MQTFLNLCVGSGACFSALSAGTLPLLSWLKIVPAFQSLLAAPLLCALRKIMRV